MVLNESPDQIWLDDDENSIDRSDGPNITFGYYKDTFLAIQNIYRPDKKEAFAHYDLMKDPDFYERYRQESIIKYNINLSEDPYYRPPTIRREDLTYPGRLFVDYNIVTIWGELPNLRMLKKISSDIKAKFKIDLFKDYWAIEISEGEFMPVTKFKGNASYNIPNVAHVVSPMLKNSKKTYVKPHTLLTKYRQFESKYIQSFKNFILD